MIPLGPLEWRRPHLLRVGAAEDSVAEAVEADDGGQRPRRKAGVVVDQDACLGWRWGGGGGDVAEAVEAVAAV